MTVDRKPGKHPHEGTSRDGEGQMLGATPAELHAAPATAEATPSRWGRAYQTWRQDADGAARTRAELAAHHIDDAFNGRLENGKAVMSRRDPLTFRIFLFHIGWRWSALLLAANFVHCMLAAFEPPHTVRPMRYVADSNEPWHVAPPAGLFLVEATCVFIYVADIALKMRYQTVRVYLSCEQGKRWQTAYAVNVALLVLDIAMPSSRRLSRPLRPVVTLLRSRPVRRFYSALTDMAPSFLRLCVPISFFLACCSVAAARFATPNMAGTADGAEESGFVGTGDAFTRLFVLLFTQENYIEVRDGLGGHPLWIANFYAFFVIGSLFLVSLILAAVFDAYQRHTTEQVKKERLKEMRGLTRAFAELDPHGTGVLSWRMWRELLCHLRPGCGFLEARILYGILANGRESVDAIDFYQLQSVLEYKLQSLGESTPTEDSSSCSTSSFVKFCTSLRQHFWLFSDRADLALLVVDMIVLANDAECQPVPEYFGIGPVTWNSLILCALGLGTLLKMTAAGGMTKYWSEANWPVQLDITSLAASALGLIPPVNRYLCGRGCTLGAIRILRLVSRSPTLQLFGRSFVMMLRVLPQPVGFSFVVIYAFAVVGMETLGSDPHFATFPDAFATMVQLQFGVNFSDVMDGAVASSGLGRPLAVSFFLAYFVLVVLLVMNLATALMIEFYNRILAVRVDADREERERRTLDLLLKQYILDAFEKGSPSQMQLRRVASGSLDDLRREIGLRKNIVEDSDIKKCQKFANVDLLALRAKREGRDDRNRSSKDMKST